MWMHVCGRVWTGGRAEGSEVWECGLVSACFGDVTCPEVGCVMHALVARPVHLAQNIHKQQHNNKVK